MRKWLIMQYTYDSHLGWLALASMSNVIEKTNLKASLNLL